ncbi:hypothetical protein N0036_08500 [Pseudomonas aeruginosa]|uniref:hypothetical protein n=1 Tax=Pseudomonas aeruginosa TaxID=287 RepID=UPI00053DF6F7|nr:hypothetical protein [Pseudomonas aeruginosa]MCO2025803.1 hypothetical protein [Pseudomonas aeruginosa]MCS7675676.1 hypothetical protein [Pseudomonas aeruginosa]MCS7904983.1 hypothetical protein [Pseudomonas aeruginosa]MCS9345746.1 hypothetical protein [Pseudomonas aeruginosa]MCS9358585.1 hypothetical protein [Pseudomonas aeruginosa]
MEKLWQDIRESRIRLEGAASLAGSIILKNGDFDGKCEILIDCGNTLLYVNTFGEIRHPILFANAKITALGSCGWTGRCVFVWSLDRSESLIQRVRQARHYGLSQIKQLINQAVASLGKEEPFARFDSDHVEVAYQHSLPRECSQLLQSALQELAEMKEKPYFVCENYKITQRAFRLSDGSGICFDNYGDVMAVADSRDKVLFYYND